jgi:hypothetical protein
MRELLAQSLPAQVAESVLELAQVVELALVAELVQVERRQRRSKLLTSEMP